MNAVQDWLRTLFLQAFRPRPKGAIADWGRANVQLSSQESQGAAGPYNPDLEPWSTVLFDFVQDPRYDELIVLKPSRVGFTLAFFVVMLWWLVHHSTDIIFCLDTSKEAKKIGKKRIIPLVKGTRALKDFLPSNERQLTSETLNLKGRTVHIAGAKSIGQVTNKPASLAGGDEVDQWEEFASGEANALEHLRDRMMDVAGSKGIYGGKPRNEEDILWGEYQTGTRHRLYVPCPHCRMMQTLEWKQVKFDHCRDEDGDFDLEKVARDTFYLCLNPACRAEAPHHGRIDEHHKAGMLARREWRQTNFGQDDNKPEPRKMSVHVSQLYSLRPKITLAAIALHFIKAQKKGGRTLAHFFRTRLGEPYREKRTVIKGEMVRALAKDSTYRHGQCPVLPAFVAMAVDVQIDVKKWVKVAFLATGEAFIIDYGECLTFDDLYEEAEKPIEILDWGEVTEAEREIVMPNFIWIDEGDGENSMKDVREFCARQRSRHHPLNGGPWVFPCKGAGGAQIKGAVDERLREVDGYQFHAYHVSHHEFATELYLQRIAMHDEIMAALKVGAETGKAVLLPAPRLHLMRNPDEEFINELCAEKRVLKKVKGRLRHVWADPTDANDYGDCVKYCLALWYFVRSDFGWDEEIDARFKQRTYILN